MKYQIRHSTVYDYAEAFSGCHNQVRLTPRELPTQRRLSSAIEIDPIPESTSRHADWYGNSVETFELYSPSDRLSIVAVSEVELVGRDGMSQTSIAWDDLRERLASDADPSFIDASQYLFESPYVRLSPELADYARPSFTPGRGLLEAARDLTRRIHRDFAYQPASTTLHTDVHEVLERRRGVCQDFAHLQVACLRSLGLPARYVSGYLRTTPPPGKPRLVGADASHAWVSVWCPQAGWTDFDPTNDVIPSDSHVTLAWGCDYGDVSPIKGVVLGGGSHRVRVGVDVVPL